MPHLQPTTDAPATSYITLDNRPMEMVGMTQNYDGLHVCTTRIYWVTSSCDPEIVSCEAFKIAPMLSSISLKKGADVIYVVSCA